MDTNELILVINTYVDVKKMNQTNIMTYITRRTYGLILIMLVIARIAC